MIKETAMGVVKFLLYIYVNLNSLFIENRIFFHQGNGYVSTEIRISVIVYVNLKLHFIEKK